MNHGDADGEIEPALGVRKVKSIRHERFVDFAVVRYAHEIRRSVARVNNSSAYRTGGAMLHCVGGELGKGNTPVRSENKHVGVDKVLPITTTNIQSDRRYRQPSEEMLNDWPRLDGDTVSSTPER
jgi:hypothetical protein